MSKVTSITVNCACKQKKNFPLSVLEEEVKKGAKPISVQVNCPFRTHVDCAKKISVELPAGYHLKKDKTYRGGKKAF